MGVIVLILLFGFNIQAQNLVPNPSFEIYDTCPDYQGQVSRLDAWFDVPNYGGSPDFFHACSNYWAIQVPDNGFGYQFPATGDGYAGFAVTYTDQLREYMEVQLTSPLVNGKTYLVSLKCSIADYTNWKTIGFGILLSQDTITGNNTPVGDPLNETPQIANSQMLEDTAGWTQLDFQYTASGGERYLTIGNFWHDSSLTYVPIDPNDFGPLSSYLYVDDFVVEEIPCYSDLGMDTTLCIGDSYVLDATSPNGANYLWQDGSTDPSLEISTPGIYAVQTTVGNCIWNDTIQIYYVPKPAVDFGADTTWCPSTPLILDAESPYTSYQWQDGATQPTYTCTEAGTYWVTAQSYNCIETDTIHVAEDCQVILEMPNIITPNGDQINDVFVPVMSKGILAMHTVILNRWGNVVFETDDQNINWSGEVNDGTYYWIVEFEAITNTRSKKQGLVNVVH